MHCTQELCKKKIKNYKGRDGSFSHNFLLSIVRVTMKPRKYNLRIHCVMHLKVREAAVACSVIYGQNCKISNSF